MDGTPQLHPSIRENIEPRVTAVALAEYLILRADPQTDVLHNSRYSQTNIRAAYASARHGFRAYNIDPLRPISTLNKVKDALNRKASNPELTPRQVARIVREIELIDLYLLRENALGLRGLPLAKAPRFSPLDINGVALSIQPDFMIEPVNDLVGAAMLRVTKAPDPDAVRLPQKKEERGEHRREMARYMLAMMELLLNDNPAYRGRVNRDLLFVSDVRLGERIGVGTDHGARIRSIEAACSQIAGLWSTIQPRASILRKPDE